MSTQEKSGDFLAAMRSDIKVRIGELKPLVDEFHRLEAAEKALDQAEPMKRRGRPPGSKNKK